MKLTKLEIKKLHRLCDAINKRKVRDEQYIIFEERFGDFFDGRRMGASSSKEAKKFNSVNEAVQALQKYGITKNTKASIMGYTTGKTVAETKNGKIILRDSNTKIYGSKVKDARLNYENYEAGSDAPNILVAISDIFENIRDGYAPTPYYVTFTKDEQNLAREWLQKLNKYNPGRKYKINFYNQLAIGVDKERWDSYIAITK